MFNIVNSRSISLLKSIMFCLLVVSFSITSVVADDDEEGEGQQILQEVFQSEVVYPQEKGEVQFTVAPQFSDNNNKGEKLFQVPLTLEYGITDAWQIELEWVTFAHLDPDEGPSENGVGDLEVGTKYSFMNIGGSDYHAALGFEVGFPTGDVDKGLSGGEGFIEYEPYLVLAKDLPELNNSHIFTQVGFGYGHEVREPNEEEEEEEGEEEGDSEWEFFVNAGLIIPIHDFRLTTEFNYSSEWNNGNQEEEIFITPGIVIDLPGTWEIGFGAPIGLNDESDDYRLIGMLTYEFNVLGEDDDDDD